MCRHCVCTFPIGRTAAEMNFFFVKMQSLHSFQTIIFVLRSQNLAARRTPTKKTNMSATKQRTPNTAGDYAPNNPLQADFNDSDNGSIDSDERYLVR
jgi:hypothetical protein